MAYYYFHSTYCILFIILDVIFLQCQSQNNFNLSSVTLPDKISRHVVSAYGDTLWVVAGRSDSLGWLTGSYSIPLPLNRNQWDTNHGTLPQGIDNLLNSEKSFSNGVTTPYKASGVCTVYNPDSNLIYAIGGLLQSVHTAVGGPGNGVNNYTQIFNVTSNEWLKRQYDALWIPRYDAGCSLSSNNTLYLFGGAQAGGGTLNLIERYHMINLTDNNPSQFGSLWTPINARLSENRSSLQCNLLTIDDNIYCVGGTTGGLVPSATVDVFDPSTETIVVTQIQLNIARYGFGATAWNEGKCLLITGGTDADAWQDSIETIGDCAGLAPTPTGSNATTITTAQCDLTNAAECGYTDLTYEQDIFCCSYVLEPASAIVSQSKLFQSVKLVRDLNIASLSLDWFFVLMIGLILISIWCSKRDLKEAKHVIIAITVLGSLLDVCLTFSVVGIINTHDLVGGINSLYEEHCYSSQVDQVLFDLSSQFQTIMVLDVTEGAVDIVSLLILLFGRFATETIGNVTEGIHAFIFSFFDVLIITVNVAMFVIPSYNTFESTYGNEEYLCFIKTLIDS
eukprot:3231_1